MNPSHPLPVRSGLDAWSRSQSLLPAVHASLLGVFEGDGALAEAGRHHLSAPGKLARARLALAACDVLGVPDERALPLAVACELLHNASLVHDDVQDRDCERRGRETVWRRFGDPAAINLGDFLLTAAVQVAAGIDAPAEQRVALVEAFTGSTLAAIRGQAADTEESLPTRERHEAIARTKTGPLLSLPVEGALALAGYGAESRAAARASLAEAGVAFQLCDDLQDLSSRKQRAPGSDLRAGRPNAVLIEYLASAPGAERARVAALERPSTAEVAELVQCIRRSSAPRRCRERAQAFAERAHRAAAGLPDGLTEVVQLAIDALLAASPTRIEVVEQRVPATEIPVEIPEEMPVAAVG